MDVRFAMADVPEACLPGELYGIRPTRRIALQSDFSGLLPRVWRDFWEDANEREGEGKQREKTSRNESLSFLSETHFTSEQLLKRERPLMLERKRDTSDCKR